jgi:hypothetical protein
MWYTLAAAQGERSADERRALLDGRMAPERVTEALDLARSWRARRDDG